MGLLCPFEASFMEYKVSLDVINVEFSHLINMCQFRDTRGGFRGSHLHIPRVML